MLNACCQLWHSELEVSVFPTRNRNKNKPLRHPWLLYRLWAHTYILYVIYMCVSVYLSPFLSHLCVSVSVSFCLCHTHTHTRTFIHTHTPYTPYRHPKWKRFTLGAWKSDQSRDNNLSLRTLMYPTQLHFLCLYYVQQFEPRTVLFLKSISSN